MPPGKRHYRLKFADAVEAHTTALRRGGAPGFLNENLVHSAIERPYNGHYRSIAQKAAALIESVCGNHGFIDGNKRTCVLLLGLLLSRSDYELVPIDGENIDEAIEQLMVDVADGRLRYSRIHSWALARITRIQV